MKIIRHFIFPCLIFLPIAGWCSNHLHWSKDITIGTNVSFAPDVAVNNDGDAVSVFIHSDGSNQRVQASIRPSGKHWRTLKHFLSPDGLDAESPKVAITPKDDDIFAVWKVGTNSQFIVQAATLDMDNPKHATVTDLTGPVDLGADPIIGVNSKGAALAVWSVFDGSVFHIQSAIHYPCPHRRKNEWIMLDDIIVDRAFELDLAFDQQGNAFLVWEGRIGFKNVIQAAILPCGSHAWARTADVSPSNTQSIFPKVGVDKHGNAIAVWGEGVTLDHIAAAKLPFGSTTWISTSNPTSTVPSGFPDLAVDKAGNAIAVWITFAGPSTTHVEASTLAAGSFAWTNPVILASSLVITDPRTVVDKHGNAIAIWSASGFLQSAFLPFDESWTTPETITPSTIGVGGQRIAMNPHGFAVITYTAQVFASSEEIVQAVHRK